MRNINENEQRYYNDIKNFKLLTPEEELEILQKIKNNPKDSTYTRKLIEANLRFVIKIAQKYQGKGLEMNELINEGNLGLIKAALKFDITQEVRFISYAVWWIRQSIQKAIYEQINLIKIPSNKYLLFKKFEGELIKNNYDMDKVLSFKEFKDYKKELIDIYNKVKTLSIDSSISPSSGSDNDLVVLDILADEPTQEEEQFSSETLEYFIEVINEALNEKEAKIIKMYYGIEYDREYTLEELGEELNLTKERIRQIKKKAIKKLYNYPGVRTFFGDSAGEI